MASGMLLESRGQCSLAVKTTWHRRGGEAEVRGVPRAVELRLGDLSHSEEEDAGRAVSSGGVLSFFTVRESSTVSTMLSSM